MSSASIQNMVHHMATGGMRPDLTPVAFWPFASKVPTHPNFGQEQTEAELLSNNSGSPPPPRSSLAVFSLFGHSSNGPACQPVKASDRWQSPSCS